MSPHPLGKLEKVNLREGWLSEATDFTPWLAQEENLTILSETIGIPLELEATEHFIGPFRADIVCKDVMRDQLVLIENQLEKTDHNHLGQILTYSSGMDVSTIIWISARFTDEHKAALDWLNEITDESYNFFGLEIELWRINDSPPAPKFNIISSPNNWSRSVSKATKQLDPSKQTELGQLYLNYWTQFTEFLEQQTTPLNTRKPSTDSYMSFSIGRSFCHLAAVFNNRDQWIAVELLFHEGGQSAFHHFLDIRGEIERDLQLDLSWEEPTEKRKLIRIYKKDIDIRDESNWDKYNQFFLTHLNKFYSFFRPRLSQI